MLHELRLRLTVFDIRLKWKLLRLGMRWAEQLRAKRIAKFGP
jgi:hypothetical protein